MNISNSINFANSLSANIDANILNALQSLLNLLGVNNFNLNNLTNNTSPVYDSVVNQKNPPKVRGKGERMIASAIPFLLSYRGLDCQEFAVFFHILARAGNGNGCFESMPNMSARLKLGVKSLRAVIQRLQEYRLIYKSEDRPGYSHVYEVYDESQWMSEEEIEQKRNELKRKKSTKPVKETKPVNADIPVINNRNVANVEKIRLSIENEVKQQLASQGLDAAMFNTPSTVSTLFTSDTIQDSAQGVESIKCLDVYPGTIDKKVENDRGGTVEIDRGILNIENTNTKKILKREEKKADPLSEKTSLSETEMAKDKDQDQKTEDLFVDAPVGKKKSELSTEQISYLEKWFSSGALKKVFTIRDEDLAALEEKERKQAEKRQQRIEEDAKASEEGASRVFGYLGCDEYGNKKTTQESRKPVKMWYAPTEEHPNYPATEPVSGVSKVKPEVKPEVKPVEVPEAKILNPVVNPVLDAVVEENDQKVIKQESDVLETEIVAETVAIEKVEVQANPVNPVAAILAKPVKPILANKLGANDQKLVDRVETYRNAFDQGKTNFTPLQLQEWAVVDGMEGVIRAYRKSGRILHSAPNDVSFEFICWLNNQHSRGSNQKDDGYALNYIKKMERTPSDWSTLMALVAQWQGVKQSGNSLFRISRLAEVEQENRNYQEVKEIMNRTGLEWKDKK